MRIIPEELVGRVFGVVRLFVLVGVFPGSLFGGWLADHAGVRHDDAGLGDRLPRVLVLLLASRSSRGSR